jgi:hypothetical protein
MTNSEQIKEVEGAVEEMDPEETALMDEYLNVIEEVRKLPDAEDRLGRIRGTIQILAGHPERAGLKTPEAEREDEGRLADDSRQIFRDFRDATVALIECDDTPRKVCEVIAEMLDELGSKCSGHAEPENEYANRVISRVFDLDDDERARREAAELEEDEELEAAERLADAFATIRELWDYVPAGLENCPLSMISGELLGCVNWENDPRAHKRVLMALLQAPEKNYEPAS